MSDPIGRAARTTFTIFLNPCDGDIRMWSRFRTEIESCNNECRRCHDKKPKSFKPLDGMQTKSGG